MAAECINTCPTIVMLTGKITTREDIGLPTEDLKRQLDEAIEKAKACRGPKITDLGTTKVKLGIANFKKLIHVECGLE